MLIVYIMYLIRKCEKCIKNVCIGERVYILFFSQDTYGQYELNTIHTECCTVGISFIVQGFWCCHHMVGVQMVG